MLFPSQVVSNIRKTLCPDNAVLGYSEKVGKRGGKIGGNRGKSLIQITIYMSAKVAEYARAARRKR